MRLLLTEYVELKWMSSQCTEHKIDCQQYKKRKPMNNTMKNISEVHV